MQLASYLKLQITASIDQLVECPLSEWEVVGSNPAMDYTKGVKNGTSSSLADARIKGVVLGRYSKAGKYLRHNCYVAE